MALSTHFLNCIFSRNKFSLLILLILFSTLQQVSANPALSINDPRFMDQMHKSVQYVLNNLQSPELRPGVVIASPSRNSPNYYYHWVRDAGLTMGEIVTLYSLTSAPQSKQNLERIIWNWIEFEKQNQDKAVAHSVLGEPIFTVTGEIYPHPWGRPQNDGPAIRALAMIQFAEILIKEGRQFEAEKLYNRDDSTKSPIKRDLDYTAFKWQEQNFDLWEEVKGQHFFTRMSQRAALLKGAELAEKLGDHQNPNLYRSKANDISTSITWHKIHDRGLVIPTLDQSDGWKHKVSQLDVSVILGSLYFSLDDDFLAPNDSMILNTAEKLENSFKSIYDVNKNHPQMAPAIGRYPEDVYNGNGFGDGNPWFLATHAYAEMFCRLAFKTQNPEEQSRLLNKGLGYLNRTLFHVDPDGHMPEQYNRTTGYTQGARDLTWSYVSYSRAFRACSLNFDINKVL